MKPTMLTLCFAALAHPVIAQNADCVTGDVTFTTNGVSHDLTLFIHETKYEVPKDLYQLPELPQYGGVLALYDGPRDCRSLKNSNMLAADMMSFVSDGNTINFLVDTNGTKADSFKAGDGMRFVLYVDGGTITAKGFGKDTAVTGLTCTEYE